MFAGDSSFGEDSIEMMEIMMLSTYTNVAMLYYTALVLATAKQLSAGRSLCS